MKRGFDLTEDIDAMIASTAIIPLERYWEWVRTGDLRSRARAYDFSENNWIRITPEPSLMEHLRFQVEFLTECLLEEEECSDPFVLTPADAGHELAGLLGHLADLQFAAKPTIRLAQHILSSAYKSSENEDLHNRLETCALEHILQHSKLQPYSHAWLEDGALRGAYERSFKWARYLEEHSE